MAHDMPDAITVQSDQRASALPDFPHTMLFDPTAIPVVEAAVHEFVTCCPDVACADSMYGSSGITIQAIGYDSNPTPVTTDVISQTSRTMVTSTSKYSATPRQTPAILRPSRGRTRRLRPITAPTRVPQYAHILASS